MTNRNYPKYTSPYMPRPTRGVPKFAIFFDEYGNQIDDKVLEIYSMKGESERFNLGTVKIEGLYLLPDIIKDGVAYKDIFRPQPRMVVAQSRKAIRKVMFNGPATIIQWKDGKKTVVKAQNDEPIDHEKGLVLAIVKYVFGNEGNYYNVIKKALKEAEYQDQEVKQ